MQYRQLFFYFFTLLALFPVTSFALPAHPDDSVWYTDGIIDVGTYGDHMEGMEVTVTFSDGTEEFVKWKATDNKSGAAAGTGWSLEVTGGATYLGVNSFVPWIFTVNTEDTENTAYHKLSVSQIFIDAGTGDTVFDIVPPDLSIKDVNSTSGSESGYSFAFRTSDGKNKADDLWETTATYSGLVALTGKEPMGDLYRYLSINFNKPVVSGTTIYFSADTDTVESALVVPEPTTLVLFGIGLAGLAGIASRKRQT